MCLKDKLKEQEMAPDLYPIVPMSELIEDLKSDPITSGVLKLLLDEDQAMATFLALDKLEALNDMDDLDEEDCDMAEVYSGNAVPEETTYDFTYDINYVPRLGSTSSELDWMPEWKIQSLQQPDINDPNTHPMWNMVDPRKVSGIHEREVKVVSKTFKLNNGISDCSEDENSGFEEGVERVDPGLDEDEVHVDHCYSFMPKREKVKVEPLPEVVEVLPARRPVGRPRKCTAVPKRYASEMEEEIVDVESIQVKRARRAPPKAKPAAQAPPKRRGRKPNRTPEYSTSLSYEPVASCSYSTTDSHGFVMRQAKNSAMKKIAKAKSSSANSSAVSRSKRNDHNDMERRRRHEMKQLFDQLRVKVPVDLLKDSNGKIKKNPSKNTILVGSHQHLCNIFEERAEKLSLLQKRSSILRKAIRIRRKLRKFQIFW